MVVGGGAWALTTPCHPRQQHCRCVWGGGGSDLGLKHRPRQPLVVGGSSTARVSSMTSYSRWAFVACPLRNPANPPHFAPRPTPLSTPAVLSRLVLPRCVLPRTAKTLPALSCPLLNPAVPGLWFGHARVCGRCDNCEPAHPPPPPACATLHAKPHSNAKARMLKPACYIQHAKPYVVPQLPQGHSTSATLSYSSPHAPPPLPPLPQKYCQAWCAQSLLLLLLLWTAPINRWHPALPKR
jgi:hypothetical protein